MFLEELLGGVLFHCCKFSTFLVIIIMKVVVVVVVVVVLFLTLYSCFFYIWNIWFLFSLVIRKRQFVNGILTSGILRVCLDIIYFVEIENLSLKVL